MADQAVELIIDAVRKESGETLLSMADELGMGIIGAGWVCAPISERWHYFLVTPMLDRRGPNWIYERLMKVFQKRPLPPAITPLDIRIMSPNDLFFRNFPYRAHMGATGASIAFELKEAPGVEGYVYAYRMLPNGSRRDMSPVFDRRVQQLMAA